MVRGLRKYPALTVDCVSTLWNAYTSRDPVLGLEEWILFC
jgi:uncharacterized protein YceH (UPF0502 family)